MSLLKIFKAIPRKSCLRPCIVAAFFVFVICSEASAADMAQVDKDIYGIYNWKKGQNEHLLDSLTPGSSNDDWYAYAVADYGIDDNYQGYLDRLSTYVSDKYASQGCLDRNRLTEWHRIAITVSALGGDPTNFGGADLIRDGIYDPVISADDLPVNGLIWAIIAADRCGAVIPDDAAETVESLCEKLLLKQNTDGGFSLRGKSDPDVTSMAILALYSREPFFAKLATAALKDMQNESGGFTSYGAENCESTAQAVMALCVMGEDPEKAFNRLMDFQNSDGGFAHVIGGASNDMASVQAMQALIAYVRYIEPDAQESAPQSSASYEGDSRAAANSGRTSSEKVSETAAEDSAAAPKADDTEADDTEAKDEAKAEAEGEGQGKPEDIASEANEADEDSANTDADETPAADEGSNGEVTVVSIVGAAALLAVLCFFILRKKKHQ